MMRLRKNDTVFVLTGKDKGKRGAILIVDDKSGKVLVKGIAIATKHVKARKSGEKSGIKKEEAFIEASKVMPICPSCDKPCRVNFKINEGQHDKVRVCNRCQSAL